MTLNARLYVGWLLALSCIFVGIHTALYFYNYEVEEVHWLILQLFDLDEENNLPTWFSSFLLLNNSLVLLILGRGQKYQVQWRILAVGFLVLSIDEVAGLHESLHTAIDTHWALLAAGLVGIVGVSFIPFLMALKRRLAAWYVISGVLFVSGAIGVELLVQDMDEETFAYTASTAVEEGMEMLGALLFLTVNLDQLRVKDALVWQVR